MGAIYICDDCGAKVQRQHTHVWCERDTSLSRHRTYAERATAHLCATCARGRIERITHERQRVRERGGA